MRKTLLPMLASLLICGTATVALIANQWLPSGRAPEPTEEIPDVEDVASPKHDEPAV